MCKSLLFVYMSLDNYVGGMGVGVVAVDGGWGGGGGGGLAEEGDTK